MDEEMYTADFTDEISELVDEAHAIFNATTVSEVMDMRDRQSQEDFLNKVYNNPEPEAINLSSIPSSTGFIDQLPLPSFLRAA